MRIMITGGGTGGHTSPAVAIIEELRARDPRLMAQWVGRRGGIEERVSRACGVPFRAVRVSGWPRRRSLRQAWVAAKLAWAVARCMLLIRRFRPQAVLGVGGYVSLPLMLAAQRLGVPTVLHEQNKRLGMANRLAAARAARLFLAYEDTLGDYPRERARVVGNPVRRGFLTPPERDGAREALGLRTDVPVALVCGGSQGARTLNAAVTGLLPALPPDAAQLVWMTGAADAAGARDAAAEAPATTLVFPFIDDMAQACAAADLVVTRAGASTTAELAVLGKPAILVPYPHATDNHQEQNARAFESAGAAVLLDDDACTPERLAAELRRLLDDPAHLEAMGAAAKTMGHPLAAETVAEAVMELVFSAGPAREDA